MKVGNELYSIQPMETIKWITPSRPINRQNELIFYKSMDVYNGLHRLAPIGDTNELYSIRLIQPIKWITSANTNSGNK